MLKINAAADVNMRATNPRIQRGLRWFLRVALVIGFYTVTKALFAFGAPNAIDKIAAAILQLIGGLLFFGLPAFALGWLTGKREDPRTAFADASHGNDARLAVDPSQGQLRGSALFDEDRAYAQALEEAESGQVDKALWSRALVAASGVESIARARYIEQRVRRLRQASRHR